MQVLGLSWSFVRKKSVLLMGEPMVAAMEKGFEMFQVIREKGVSGMWEYIKEQFTDLKETIIESIKSMLITQVIEAGIKWLLSLLIPGAGFIKAIMAIKDLIVFFVQSAIMLIPSLIQAIKSLASGNVAGVAKAIEKGLAMLLPLVISLFAKLIGLGGLVKKVQKIIKKVRKRIDRAVTKMIKKAKKKFNKILGKKKPKKGQAKKIKKDNKNQKPDKVTAKDKAKHKKIANTIEKKIKGKKGDTKELTFEQAYKKKEVLAKILEDKYQPQLKKGINLDIIFNKNIASDKKDGDIDFKIVIKPNTTKKMSSVEIKARLNEKDVVDVVKQEAIDTEKQIGSAKLPSWAAVFAIAGQKVNIEKGANKGEALTLSKIVSMSEFKKKMRLALFKSSKTVRNKLLNERGVSLSNNELVKEIRKVVEEVANNIANKELTFITPTDIIRSVKVKGNKFVKINKKLRKLRASKSKALYHKTSKNAQDIMNTQLTKEMKNANLKPEIHHTGSLYLGFGHELQNLLTLFGNAGVPTEPHGMMHEFIDKADITKFMDSSSNVTLDNSSLRKHFNDDKLEIMLGTLKTDGRVSYKKANLKLKK